MSWRESCKAGRTLRLLNWRLCSQGSIDQTLGNGIFNGYYVILLPYILRVCAFVSLEFIPSCILSAASFWILRAGAGSGWGMDKWRCSFVEQKTSSATYCHLLSPRALPSQVWRLWVDLKSTTTAQITVSSLFTRTIIAWEKTTVQALLQCVYLI